jgi:hypothetical protein
MGLGSSRAPHLIPSNEKNAAANLPRKQSSPQKIPVFEGDNKLTEPIPITSPVGSPSQSQSLPNQPLFDGSTMLHSPSGIGSQQGTMNNGLLGLLLSLFLSLDSFTSSFSIQEQYRQYFDGQGVDKKCS